MDTRNYKGRALCTSTLDRVLELFDRLDDEMDANRPDRPRKGFVEPCLKEAHCARWAERLADLEEEFDFEMAPKIGGAAGLINPHTLPKNNKGLHGCKPSVFWLPDLDSNQGPAD